MKSINTKIIVLLCSLVFIVSTGLGIAAYIISLNSQLNILAETMPKVAEEASVTIKDGMQNHLNTLNIIASMEEIKAFTISDKDADISGILSIMSKEVERAGHTRMILVDGKGHALYDNGETANMKDNPFIAKALSGENVVSDPMLGEDRETVIMLYAVPVKVEDEVTGALIAIRDGMELSDFARRVKFGQTGEAFIINQQGLTIAHADKNLLKQIISTASADTTTSATTSATKKVSSEEIEITAVEEGGVASELGFKGFTEVQRQMMEGKKGFEKYEYSGTLKVVGFAPIEGYGWSIAVAVDQDEVLSGLSELKRTIILISFAFLLTGSVAAYFIGRGISRPIIHLTRQCIAMAEGDFTKTIEDKYTKRSDEIGALARGFLKINVNVSGIIRNVLSETNRVGRAVEIVNSNMVELNEKIKNMSDIIQQLSSKMEETAAMAEEMHATSTEIEAAIDSIAGKAQEGAESASEVNRRAEELKATALDSQKSAQLIRESVAGKLREAIEKSKAVEKIRILSETILKMSAQTNLLALNASIEASNAGKAGRGFAVVAGEIRRLAENSKQTVNEIQKVTEQIVESVQNLAASSEQVLDFLDNKVVKDYDMLVETGKNYNNDARMIDEIVEDLSATSEELYSSIQIMMKAINNVAEAANKGASETSCIAAEANAVAQKTREVLEQMQVVNESAKKLFDAVRVFKVLES
nr:MAG: methyl-accepting chemotaxis protein [Bacillota bacterium]